MLTHSCYSRFLHSCFMLSGWADFSLKNMDEKRTLFVTNALAKKTKAESVWRFSEEVPFSLWEETLNHTKVG